MSPAKWQRVGLLGRVRERMLAYVRSAWQLLLMVANGWQADGALASNAEVGSNCRQQRQAGSAAALRHAFANRAT